MPQPPRLVRWLLARTLPREEREFVIGDLEETFERALDAGRDIRAMRRWYRRAAFGAVMSFASQDARAPMVPPSQVRQSALSLPAFFNSQSTAGTPPARWNASPRYSPAGCRLTSSGTS